MKAILKDNYINMYIKNKTLNIKIIFKRILKNIKNGLKTFYIHKCIFVLQNIKKLFSKIVFKIIFEYRYQIGFKYFTIYVNLNPIQIIII